MTTQHWKCNNIVVRIQITEICDREDPLFYISKRNSLFVVIDNHIEKLFDVVFI